MARYTPKTLAALKRRYEDTDEPMPAIAAACGISLRTLHRMVEREGWAKRAARPARELPPAARLLEQALALEHAQAPTAPAPPAAAARPDAATGSPVDRLEALLLNEIAAEERACAAGRRVRSGRERSSRALASLTQTLQSIQRMRADSMPKRAFDDDDDMPADIEEFRRELAGRIDAFVASRTDGGDTG